MTIATMEAVPWFAETLGRPHNLLEHGFQVSEVISIIEKGKKNQDRQHGLMEFNLTTVLIVADLWKFDVVSPT